MSQSSGHAPLVWFTTLAIAGAGMIAVAAWHLPDALAGARVGLLAGSAALGASLLVSTFHLGRRWRAPFAIRGVGRSSLSQEVLLAVMTLAAGLGLIVWYPQVVREPWLRMPAGTITLLCLLSIGRVYQLGGQQSWRGSTVLLPLTTGLVIGDLFLWAAGDSAFERPLMSLWLISLDAVVFGVRWRMLIRRSFDTKLARRETGLIHRLSATRLLLLDIMPLAFLSIDAAPFAFVAGAVGLVFDRWLFYELADQHTTEAEIARVEAIIGRESRIS